jgi:hypothetical protein
VSKYFYMVAILVLAGCTTVNQGITVGSGEESSLAGVRTFEVNAVNMPAFLGPIVASNFSVAMAERGFQPVGENGDAVVTLRFEQDDIGQERQRDSFDEQIDQGGDLRFVARVVADLMVKNTGSTIRLGSIQRMHTVMPGDYMHTGRASIALLQSFREMLSDIQMPDTETGESDGE